MSGKIVIVPMEKRHLAALARLEAACFSQPWSEQGLRAELQNPAAHFLVAELDGATVGYLGMHGVCGEGYIANVAVLADFRRRGVARALMRAAEALARRADYAFLTLEVRVSNQAAIDLYESEGYAAAGRRKGFYTAPTEDALIMTKTF